MKTPKDLIIIIFVVLFSVSCAGVSKIPFKTMVEEADSRVGESVILGGYVLDAHMSGDRTDICLAALETDTNLIILTGGVGPEIGTLTRARELGVPIMMTALDTYGTSQVVDDLIGTITVDNKEKIAAVERIVGEALQLDELGL